MEDSDRKHIIKNVNELIRTTKFLPLLMACERERIFSDIMRSRIENLPDANEHEKHKELFIKLTKRGPTAYESLIKILFGLRFDEAARILRAPKLNASNCISLHKRNPLATTQSQAIPTPGQTPREPLTTVNRPSVLPEGCYPSKDNVDSNRLQLKPCTRKIDLPSEFVVQKSKDIHYDKKLNIYPMRTRNRGVFFMVNIIEFKNKEVKRRSGAEMDSKYLLQLFRELGFVCFEYENLSMDEFFYLLTELRESEYLERTESFVLALMSHGEMKEDMHDRVQFYEGAICKVIEIEDFFSNENCEYLRKKPKVLIFPFCRGERPDFGIRPTETDGFGHKPPLVNRYIPIRSDMLVCYASVRGFEALRDPDTGSFYIQIFCKILARHAHDTHLEDMLKLVGEQVSRLRSAEGYLQTPAFYNHGFNSQLFFNPGVYDEGEGVKEMEIVQ